MSYRDRRDRDDYRSGGYRDRDRGYGGGRDYGRDSYGGGGGGGGYGRDRYGGGGGGGRNDWDRRDRDGGRRFGGGGGGGDRRSGGGGGGGRRFGGGGGGRGGGDFKRKGGPGNGPPPKRQRDENNWKDEDRHEMMQSMFMESRPENLEQDWVFMVCPPGKRRLLVAASEITQSYNNAGAEDLRFKSCLPSGCDVRGELDKISDITILDTVYNAEKKMFYVVDLLHWKHYPYYDTETETRYYFLNDKWAQLKSPLEKTDNNEYPLELLTQKECSDENIVNAIKEYEGKIEGLMFIKKSAVYKFKESQDCLWLKLDKMEKLLGISLPEGINFAASNTKDEKRLQEQETRKRQFEERVAARMKKQADAAAAAEAGAADGAENVDETNESNDNEGIEQAMDEDHGEEEEEEEDNE